ncbi:MAG: ATP synthase F0 subunit C, partial [Magnetococcales bacterium]|nr:ATP synthase F0 subunit C [Magnetococcales bacterium]
FGKTIESVARQPGAESQMSKYVWIGAAFVEAIALYGLVIAFIIMGKG